MDWLIWALVAGILACLAAAVFGVDLGDDE